MQNPKKISHIFRSSLASDKIVNPRDTALVFFDLTFLEERVGNLKKQFPKSTLHAVAIKANPLLSILKRLKKLGTGAEAASLPEIHLALRAGFSPEKIVFDSPAKTKDEIHFALEKGITLNADSFEELGTIRKYLGKKSTKSKIGVRVNPQVGTGAIAETSVAGEYSKFGIPIKEYKKALQQFFLDFEWLRGVHVHIGSQGISLDMLCKGTKSIYDFALETNQLLVKNSRQPIVQFDIGGGLPVSYSPDQRAVPIELYCQSLQKCCPLLFTDKFRIITEFGRYIHAHSGWAISRVECIKKAKSSNTAIIHLGADMFLREAYMPGKWHHEICILDKTGRVKRGEMTQYAIAGPLCFSGDVLNPSVLLPEIVKGDFLVVMDVGAYTLSMWSRYNSRQMPKIVGYENDGERFTVLKRRESVESIIDFWR